MTTYDETMKRLDALLKKQIAFNTHARIAWVASMIGLMVILMVAL